MVRKARFGVAAALSVLLAGTASAQKQTLHMAYWAGPSHQMVQAQQAWIKTIEEASGGNLAVEVDKAGLAKPEGQYDLIKNGVRDMVWAVAAYTPSRFDLLQASELPLVCPNPRVCSPVLWKWYDKNNLAAKEFTDTKLLAIFIGGPFHIHTVKPATTLEELKGMKLRAGGSGVPPAKALGLSIVAMPATDAYEAIQRGTVEGTIFPWEAMESFRLNEMLKAHLEIPGGISAPVFVIVGNIKAIDGLTPANRAALMKASGEAGSALFGKAWDAADQKARDDAKARGQTIQTLAPAELERWRALLKPVSEQWIETANKKGVDGRKLLDDLQAMIKAASS